MNYVSISTGTNTNEFAGSEEFADDDEFSKDQEDDQDHIILLIWDHADDDFVPKIGDGEPSNDVRKEGDENVFKATNVNTEDSESSGNAHSTARP